MSEERAPYHAGLPEPKLQKLIIQAIQLPSDSRIQVHLDMPEGKDTDLAMSAFDILLEVLKPRRDNDPPSRWLVVSTRQYV